MRTIMTSIALAGISILLAPKCEAGDRSIGVIGEYRPAAARLVLKRAPDGREIPIRIGTIVAAEDSVTLPAGASVVVQLASGERKQFSGAGTFQMPKSNTLGTLARFFESISSLFDDEYRLEGTAASRGAEQCDENATVDSMEIPLLAHGASMTAGTRDLPLAWTAGCGPFQVELWSASKGSLVRERTTEHRLRLDAIPFEIGDHRVTIIDSRGRKIERVLTVVDQAPRMPSDLANDTSALGTIAQAIWLAEQDGGRWRIESFDRLRPLIRGGNELAGAIGDGVLWGMARD